MSELRERYVAPPDDSASVTGSRVQLPQWLFVFLLLQTVSAIWWAASLSADVRYLQAENAKLWEKVEVVKMQQDDTDKKLDERIRQKVRETLDDAGFLRISPGGE